MKQTVLTHLETDTAPCVSVVDLGILEYVSALALQEERVAGVSAGTASEILFVLEHPAVITLGRSGGWTQVRVSPEELARKGISVQEVTRGGGATYHGPGQVVVYPVVSLDRWGGDIHLYLRTLERAMILCCLRAGVQASQREGLTGVWVNEKKIGFIGVAVRRGIAYHGMALNVVPVGEGFGWIHPCGLEGVVVTSLQEEGARISVSQVRSLLPILVQEALEKGGGAEWL
jgi:lipoate-protein ligase B